MGFPSCLRCGPCDLDRAQFERSGTTMRHESEPVPRPLGSQARPPAGDGAAGSPETATPARPSSRSGSPPGASPPDGAAESPEPEGTKSRTLAALGAGRVRGGDAPAANPLALLPSSADLHARVASGGVEIAWSPARRAATAAICAALAFVAPAELRAVEPAALSRTLGVVGTILLVSGGGPNLWTHVHTRWWAALPLVLTAACLSVGFRVLISILAHGGPDLTEGFFVGAPVAAVLTWLYHANGQARERRRQAKAVVMAHTQRSLRAVMGAAPSWITSSEYEKVEWLNAFLVRAWPYVNEAVCTAIRESVEPILDSARPSFIRSIVFDRLNFGEDCFRIAGVKTHPVNEAADEIMIDLDFRWDASTSIIKLGIRSGPMNVSVGVGELEIYFKVRLRLKPLIKDLSIGCIGALTVSLCETPNIDFDLKLPPGLDTAIGVPLEYWLRPFLRDTLGDMLLWPNRLVIPLVEMDKPVETFDGTVITMEEYVQKYLDLQPHGVLHVQIYEAKAPPSKLKLKSAGHAMMRAVTSTAVNVQLQVRACRTVNSSPRPRNELLWDPEKETYDLLVEEIDRPLKVTLIETAGFGTTEKLADAEVDLQGLVPGETKVKDVSLGFGAGSIRLGLTFVPFKDVARADDSSGVERGLLVVRLKSGENLKAADWNGKSDPYATLAVGKLQYQSQVVKESLQPEWNETFEFVSVRSDDTLTVKVADLDFGTLKAVGLTKADPLGDVSIEIADVKAAKNGMLEDTWKLQNVDTGSITMNLQWVSFGK